MSEQDTNHRAGPEGKTEALPESVLVLLDVGET